MGADRGCGSRLARRGGVKRISFSVYDEARHALKAYLTEVRNAAGVRCGLDWETDG